MADALTEVDIDALETAIENDIKAGFPDLLNVEFYGEERQGMTLPACLLEISEWTEANDYDSGTGQQAVLMRFEARIIIDGVATKVSKKEIRKRSADFTAFLYKRRWSDSANPGKTLPTDEAELVGAYYDEFSPELDQFEVWRIEWQQVVFLGTSGWKPQPSDPPTPELVTFVNDGTPYATMPP